MLYLEDLTPGRVFDMAGEVTVSEAEIVAFAQAFDPQPFHLDAKAAKSSIFGGLAASGWHTAALTMRLLVQNLPVGGGIVGVQAELQWPAPTRPGDTLRVRSEVIEARASQSKPEQGIAKLRTTTTNQRGVAVQVFTATMVVPVRGR